MVIYKKDNNKILAPLLLQVENIKQSKLPIQVGDIRWNSIAYGNGKYVAVGVKDNTSWSTTSIDGTTWSTPVQVGTFTCRGVTYGNGKFVSVGSDGYITTSTDGTTWSTPVQVRKLSNGNEILNLTWYSVTYGNNKFVAVGMAGLSGYATTSTDGTTWSTLEEVSNRRYSVTYGNSKFVAVGYAGRITTSRDGVTWSTPVQVGTFTWYGVSYGNNKFVAVGSSGYVTTSTDGVTWSTPQQTIDITWNGITYKYKNKEFVIVGNDGYIGYQTALSDYRCAPFTLAYNKDIIYAKNTDITSVPIIYAKNDESRSVYIPDLDHGMLNTVGSIQSVSLYQPEILTGFSSTSYCEFNTYFPPSNSIIWDLNYWTWVFTFKHHQTNVIQRIFSQGKSYPSGIEISSDNKLCLTISTSTSSYNIVNAVKGTTILEDGKWYQVVVEYLGGLPVSIAPNGYEVRLKDLDNNNETLEIYSTKRTNISATNTWLLGYEPKRNDGKTAFSGELDLKNCYITVGGEQLWSGTSGTITVDKNNYDIKTEKIRRYI